VQLDRQLDLGTQRCFDARNVALDASQRSVGVSDMRQNSGRHDLKHAQ
jgi:hypothetical protein